MEKDPDPKVNDSEKSGYNFVIRTVERDYRMKAETKSEQIAWARAFTTLFELRARVAKVLMTSIKI